MEKGFGLEGAVLGATAALAAKHFGGVASIGSKEVLGSVVLGGLGGHVITRARGRSRYRSESRSRSRSRPGSRSSSWSRGRSRSRSSSSSGSRHSYTETRSSFGPLKRIGREGRFREDYEDDGQSRSGSYKASRTSLGKLSLKSRFKETSRSRSRSYSRSQSGSRRSQSRSRSRSRGRFLSDRDGSDSNLRTGIRVFAGALAVAAATQFVSRRRNSGR